MNNFIGPRDFLRNSAAIGAATLTCGIPLHRAAAAATVKIDAPVLDCIVVREINDNTHDIFLKGAELLGLTIGRTGFPQAPQGKTLESEWGLALHI
jgi:hypothetical protein